MTSTMRPRKSAGEVQEISKAFGLEGVLEYVERVKVGHINETYAATYITPRRRIRYIHQKINQHVFRDPRRVMANIVRITHHIRSKLPPQAVGGDVSRKVLTVVHEPRGAAFIRDDEGDFWRTYEYVEGGETHDSARSAADAGAAGKAFGEFQRLVSDLPGPALHESIRGFHDGIGRLHALRRAIERDTHHRTGDAREEIAFALSRSEYVNIFHRELERGSFPIRISHNDAKLNNVMLDGVYGEPLVVLDLDTVMSGSVLYDIGDLIRTATCRAREDERDLDRVRIEIPLYEALVQGYLREAVAFLSSEERSHIAFSGLLMTFMVGVRFLTDYLSGDTYFRIERPQHNLERTRAQWKLLRSLEENRREMEDIVDRIAGTVTS